MKFSKKKIINHIRKKLKDSFVVSGWMQICSAEIAEIFSQKNFDVITLDLEHGSFDIHELNGIFRAIENGGKLPLVRLPNHSKENLGQIFDAGSGGVIIPNINNLKELVGISKYCFWPPKGKRGVGFSRANSYGNRFEENKNDDPIIIAMIENIKAINNLDEILKYEFLDAILIGPYDLSASMGSPGNFKSKKFKLTLNLIKSKCKQYKIPCGIHVVKPSKKEFNQYKKKGFKFLPFSMDTVLLNESLNLKF